MTTSWKFSAGLSIMVFISAFAVMSFLTPAHQTLAAKINHPTLRAAAAVKTAMR
jgi:hypothetical protein